MELQRVPSDKQAGDFFIREGTDEKFLEWRLPDLRRRRDDVSVQSKQESLFFFRIVEEFCCF